MISITCI